MNRGNFRCNGHGDNLQKMFMKCRIRRCWGTFMLTFFKLNYPLITSEKFAYYIEIKSEKIFAYSTFSHLHI